jgi:hypothetical protein
MIPKQGKQVASGRSPVPSGVAGAARLGGLRVRHCEVRARFDLVGFDPRGIARSTPGVRLTSRVPPRGTVCEPDVVPFAEPAVAAQTLQVTGASGRAALIPPMLRRLLAD